MSTPTFVQFGAGNIGRSLVGQLFARAGYEVIFIDAIPQIIDALNAQGRYLLRIKDRLPAGATGEVWVEGVRGILAGDAEQVAAAVATASVIGTAVGPAVLPRLAPALAAGLVRRATPVSILLCENLRNAAGVLRAALAAQLPADFDLPARVGLVETSIGKMVPIMPAAVREQDPLEVWSEAYNQIIADRDGFLGEPPDVAGLVLKRNFAAYVDRKLFVHNLGHAAAAYHGHLAGKRFIWECMEDAALRQRTRATMWEAGQALRREYPGEFSEPNLAEHVEDLLSRFANQALGDSVWRVGRDLPRKLSPEDRCIGALRLAVKHGVEPTQICSTIAAALRFTATDEQGQPYPPDAEIMARVEREGPRPILLELCGLKTPEDQYLIETIIHEHRQLAAGV